MTSLFMEGLLLQASLIFALGAQNIFVLESGLRRQYHLSVSFVCFFCDFVLIMLGVAGAATVFSAFPQLKIVVGLVGVVFMFHYGMGKIFSKADTENKEVLNADKNFKRSIILAFTFSIFNPHAYLDAFILIGGFSAKYAVLSDRLWLGLGAACFSLIWFLILSSASSYMKPFLSNPQRMRVVSSVAGVCLIVLSAKLGVDVYDWMIESGRQPQLALESAFALYPSPPGQLFTSILF